MFWLNFLKLMISKLVRETFHPRDCSYIRGQSGFVVRAISAISRISYKASYTGSNEAFNQSDPSVIQRVMSLLWLHLSDLLWLTEHRTLVAIAELFTVKCREVLSLFRRVFTTFVVHWDQELSKCYGEWDAELLCSTLLHNFFALLCCTSSLLYFTAQILYSTLLHKFFALLFAQVLCTTLLHNFSFPFSFPSLESLQLHKRVK